MNNKKMTAAERFAAMGKELRKDGRLQIDAAKVEISERIFRLMEDKGITEAELARRLETSRAYVNKVLQGSTNFTVESLVKIGIALDCEFKMEFTEPKMDILDAEIVYYKAEKPIAEPKVVSKPKIFEGLNIFNFSDFKINKTVKDVTGNRQIISGLEKVNATFQDAA